MVWLESGVVLLCGLGWEVLAFVFMWCGGFGLVWLRHGLTVALSCRERTR